MDRPAGDARRLEEPPTIGETDRRARQRTQGERDRDRILYAAAFQRLAGITQVIPAGTGQAVHSRLTHSLKVAQVARRLAQRLLTHHPELEAEIDPDSAEASALAHDLGHPPFGHIAEEELCSWADVHTDGFEGNAQSFRLITRLAQRWPDIDGEQYGLNLTRLTLDGTLKYPWPRRRSDVHSSKKWGVYEEDEAVFGWVREGRAPRDVSLVARVMDWADDLTYAVHDMEDFYRAGMIPLDRLCTSERERERFTDSFVDNPRMARFAPEALLAAVEDIFGRLDFVDPYSGTRFQRQILRERTSFMIRDYLHALECDGRSVRVDEALRIEVAVMKELTWFYVIHRPDLATIQEGQRRLIRHLCDRFWDAAKNHEYFLFPPLEQEALRSQEMRERGTDAMRARLVCDFISRLTETRALEIHQRLLGTAIPLLPLPAH